MLRFQGRMWSSGSSAPAGPQPSVTEHTLISLDLHSTAGFHGWKASVRSGAGLEFEKNVLDCCMFLMTQSYPKTMNMRDPVMVGRNMGAMCCGPSASRRVTVFDCAHHTEEDLTLDVFVNEMGRTVPNKTNGSIWALLLRALARGRRPQGQHLHGLRHQVRVLGGERRQDKLVWLVRTVGGREKASLLAVETVSIGKNISTKAVGQDRHRTSPTSTSYPKVAAVSHTGSSEERAVMDHAFLLLSFKREYTIPVKENLLELSVREEPVLLGDPLSFSVTRRRKAATPQTVTFSGSFDLQSYTGKQLAYLGVIQKTVHVEDEVSSVVLTWDSSTYTGSLDLFEDEPVIKGFILVEVMETKETIATEGRCVSGTPSSLQSSHASSISPQLPNKGGVGQALTCTCTFRNSLVTPLTHVMFSVESLGLSSLQSTEQGTVPPGKTMQSQIRRTPVKAGPRKFVIKLSSQQVKEIHAEKMVLITQ
ncbi:Protein-glutamine gamma-glutamyltransferase 4 [Fukomys damarensis]|uniref:Protein-glutamine gamma-glutamyltransferase 4 n=1 Tax=Fukomys damarensis TaxID=885580 RepID=A0A091DQE2_FUKDA|nr:Protein-glutamine gamma-glutamyltransferase 4 [Fukomys damarensis]